MNPHLRKRLKKMLPFLIFVLVGGVVGTTLAIRRVQNDLDVATAKSRRAGPSRDVLPNTLPLPPDKDHPVIEPSRPMSAALPPTAETPRVEARVPVSTGLISFEAAKARLHLVGADEEADAFWLRAINDPRVPANQRKDLIEDLNQEGFADPKNPTEDDLPLILARLQLIEDHSDIPMDVTNGDAFGEAYKDLLDMLDKALGDQIPGR